MFRLAVGPPLLRSVSEEKKFMSIVVVGSVAFDSIKTPRGQVQNALGGSAVHFALSARHFADVQLVGVVGNDFPDENRELLESHKIDLTGLEVVPDGKTFRWSGEYFDDMNQRETLSVELNVFESFTPRIPQPYRDSRFVFLANGAPETQMSVLEQMDGKPFVMADTMDLWIQTKHQQVEDLLRRIDGLVLNDQEAFLLADTKNMIKAGELIRQNYDLEVVVVKKGEHGCLIFREGDRIALPAYPLLEVLDPTGAGDSFAGGLMGYMCQEGRTDTETFKKAVAWGTVSASYCCEGFGVSTSAELQVDQANSRFEHFSNMVKI